VGSAPSAAMTIPGASDLDPYALQPRGWEDLNAFAITVVDSRLYGSKFGTNVSAVMIAVGEARERGIAAGVALRSAYVVHDQLAWSTAYIVGLVKKSGLCEYIEIVETTAERAVVEYKKPRRPAKKFDFTIQEARDAGWVKAKSKWETNPRTMLRWAAFRECCRFEWPEVVSGVYSPDDIRDGAITDAEFEQTAADMSSAVVPS